MPNNEANDNDDEDLISMLKDMIKQGAKSETSQIKSIIESWKQNRD